jgi:predicted aldo/keto reductase-like oxidoreductase
MRGVPMQFKRRELLKGTLATLLYAIFPQPSAAGQSDTLPKRLLGRTGLEVSVLGYGAMQVSDPDIIRYGLEQGINYIDTADCYLGGRNEKVVGKAVAGIRDRIVIATKVHIAKESRMRRSVDRSLSSLGIERVDLMQLHGVTSREQVVRKDVQNIMRIMQQEGKFRFAGVTTHSNQIEVLEAVMDDGFYDAVLVAVNFRSPKKLFETIRKAADSGVGIIAMKTQNGGFKDNVFPELTPHQAALRYVVDKPGIHVAVPGMLSRNMITENVGAMIRKTDLSDVLRLENYRRDLVGKACSFCSGCRDQCRYGIGGLDVTRTRMYLEGYGDRNLAMGNGRAVLSSIKRCANCEECTVTCSQGIDIKASAQQMYRYIAERPLYAAAGR